MWQKKQQPYLLLSPITGGMSPADSSYRGFTRKTKSTASVIISNCSYPRQIVSHWAGPIPKHITEFFVMSGPTLLGHPEVLLKQYTIQTNPWSSPHCWRFRCLIPPIRLESWKKIVVVVLPSLVYSIWNNLTMNSNYIIICLIWLDKWKSNLFIFIYQAN